MSIISLNTLLKSPFARPSAILTLLFLAAIAPLAHGQAAPQRPVARFYPPQLTPDRLRQVVSALGDRLKEPGRERLTMTGNLQIGTATSLATVIIELPGRVRIEHAAGRSRALAFDLASLNGRSRVDDEDEDLLESLGLDTTEQFLYLFDSQTPIRLLGHGFRVSNESGFGSTVDIFQATIRGTVRRDQQLRVKQFMFDASTGLLRRVAYSILKGNQPLRVTTEYSAYSNVNGTLLPGLVVRQENGREVLRFQRTGASITGLVNDTAFRQP